MEAHEPYISVLDPIGPSIEHTKTILFRPFDLDRWLAIGFCAWLATFGDGCSFNFRKNIDHEHPAAVLHEAKDIILANLPWLIPVFIVGAVIVIGLWLLFLWLSSRGRFMFLNNVVYNTSDVARPWHYYKHLAHSLLLFRVVLCLIGLGTLIGLGIVGTVVVIPLWQTSVMTAVLSLIFFIPLILLVSFGLLIIEVLTTDFIVPLMLKHTLTCTGAWSQLRNLTSFNKGRFFLYLIVKVVINFMIGSMVLLISLATCGCACCLAAIPYLGTVLLLPFITFKRAYSIHYLRQYGPYFDLLIPSPPAKPTPHEEDNQTPLGPNGNTSQEPLV